MLFITLEIEVNSGAENGDGGLLELVVTSVSNAANRSGKVTFSLSVETVLDAELFVQGDDEKDITFGQIGKSPRFEVDVINAGNIESEFKIFSSGGVRGWNVILKATNLVQIVKTRVTTFCVIFLLEIQFK